MGKALYRKYRSKSLSEIIGQEHITTTLQNALKAKRIAHAYLLTGPRGVGKTSIARILAHEINELPYSEDMNLDIIEIDAASNNGVEDVRDLREKIPAAPVSAQYKVFIIDEVHMLSKAAFNALLKTLEEPPAHVVFILATTEAYKLPETIISRTQRFTFRPVAANEVIAHLKTIANKEKIQIDDEALALIAAHGDGSFRDSISLLDQVSSMTENIHQSDVERLLGLAPSHLIKALLTSLETSDSTTCVSTLDKLYDEGYEPAMIAAQLGSTLRTQFIAGSSVPTVLDILKDLLDVPGSRNPKALLEITLLRHIAPTTVLQQPVATPLAPISTPKPVAKHAALTKHVEENNEDQESVETKILESVIEQPHIDTSEQKVSSAPEVVSATSSGETDITKLWQEILQQVKQTHNTLYGIARMATPHLEDDTLTLELKFAFHQKRLNEPRNKAVFADIVEKIRQTPTQVVCVVASNENKLTDTNVATISNIFGGAELLES